MDEKLMVFVVLSLVAGIGVGLGLGYAIYQPDILLFSLLKESMDIQFLRVGSGSMEPALYKGDLIVVQGVSNASDIKVGPKDSAEPGVIIVFHKPTDPSELIVHRAIDKELRGGTWYFQTKADANVAPDNWDGNWKTDCDLAEEYVVGKVVAVVS